MKFTRKILHVIPLFMIILLQAGCATSQIRIGWAGSQTKDQIAYTFEKFRGFENAIVQGDSGQTLFLSVDTEVNEGKLNIQVTNPEESVLWEKGIQENYHEIVELPISIAGDYEIIVIGQDTKGSFDVSWEIR